MYTFIIVLEEALSITPSIGPELLGSKGVSYSIAHFAIHRTNHKFSRSDNLAKKGS